MSNDISSVSSQMDSLRWSEQSKSAQTEKKSDALTQEDFFSLLTQQLSFQDPSKPADNDQMISQMTNFTMAEGISGLNEKFDMLSNSMTSNSALQASTLVGKKALLESDTIEFGDDQLAKGSIIATKPVESLTISIFDERGQLVRQMDMGMQKAGGIRFEWDGKNGDGEVMPAGSYSIKAEGRSNGEYSSLPMATFKNIDSVNVNGANGIIVNTSSGAVKLSDVAEIA